MPKGGAFSGRNRARWEVNQERVRRHKVNMPAAALLAPPPATKPAVRPPLAERGAAVRRGDAVHGMAEHAGRYERLAAALSLAGYHFYAIDQRGGRTAEADELGHGKPGGWGKVVGDLASLNHHIRQQHPELPIFLLGHSMGNYISMAYLLRLQPARAILSGSNYQPQALWSPPDRASSAGARKPAGQEAR